MFLNWLSLILVNAKHAIKWPELSRRPPSSFLPPPPGFADLRSVVQFLDGRRKVVGEGRGGGDRQTEVIGGGRRD